MLKQMRAQAKNLKFVLWLVILSFLFSFVWFMQGGAGDAGGRPTDFAARINDRVITIADFYSALQEHDRRLRDQLGDAYSQDFLNAPGVLDGLVNRQVLLMEAESLGIIVTPGQVAETLRSLKGLQDEQGRFDRATYEAYLQTVGQRPAEFEAQLADSLRLEQLEAIMLGGVILSEGELWKIWARDNDSAIIEYVLLPLAEYEPKVTLTEAEIRSYFDAHLAEFDAGEGRNVRWARFSREAFQKALENEDEMRRYYDENVDAIYTMTEDQRRASLILVAIAKDADEHDRKKARDRAARAAEGARAGLDFTVLAGGWSDDLATNGRGGDLGPFYKGSLEPEVEPAVFAAAEGAVVGPIATSRGLEILLVTKGPGRKARPYDDVKPLVARGLYARRAAENLEAAIKKFQGAVTGSADFDAAAATAGIGVEGPAWITQDGQLPGLERSEILGREALSLDIGGISEPIALGDEQVILTVLEKRDSSARSFDEARPAVEAAARRAKARELARIDAEDLHGRAVYAEVLKRAAGDRPVQNAGPFFPGRPIPGLGNAPDVSKAAFETRTGEFGRVADAPEGVVVFFVNSHKRPEESRFRSERKGYEESQREQRMDALRRDLVARLRKSYEALGRIEINQSVLAPFQKARNG